MGICNEKSGFLFSHECFRSPIGNCSSCQKPVCEDHSHAFDGNVLCTSCAKKDRKRRGRDETGRQYGPSRHYDDHDPYFYGGYYYGATYYDSYHHHGSSVHDPHDFTEADAESLASEGDEGFESDMSES
ncbi:MAG: hypothetical protein CMJ50_07950 [Planctomycetaceae bacterium]|nr:hypothetical protein [Planctomycetaceae bacterium]